VRDGISLGGTSETPRGGDLDSVDLILRLLELLAGASGPRGVTDIAGELAISKARAHRHLRALVNRGYAVQDGRSEGYEVGVKVLSLGEKVRERFDVIGAIRPVMAPLRAASGLAVTASALVREEVIVLEMLQGESVIEFGVRPGSRLDLHASAHGLVTLAFGPPDLMAHVLAAPLRRWTDRTLTDPDAVKSAVARARRRGWATAANAVQVGVNALAAPVRDHRGVCRGAVAIVGATQFIAAEPAAAQIALVRGAAAQASRSLGFEGA
jgi:DNA-binding IclR family transcriptional regulator